MPRNPIACFKDEEGAVSADYALALLGFALPLILAAPNVLQMLYNMFYRIAGVLSLPFA